MIDNLYGLIFDVDGVIADTESMSAKVTAGILDELFGIKGVTYDDFNAGRGRGAEAYLRSAAEKHGLNLTADQLKIADEMREKGMIEYIEQNPFSPCPGVLELIHSGLSDPRFRLAIATSSTRENSQKVLISTGVPYERMAYITGSDVSNKKPHPELFLTAARKMSLPPERCLVVEDAPSGIEAANNAGCKCLAVTNSFPADKLRQAHRITDSLEKISIPNIIALIDQN